MGSDQHLPLNPSLPSLVSPMGLPLYLFHDAPAECLLERVRSVSAVGLYDVSDPRFLFFRLILLFVCLIYTVSFPLS